MHVDVDAEQVADRARVLGAVEALERAPAGIRDRARRRRRCAFRARRRTRLSVAASGVARRAAASCRRAACGSSSRRRRRARSTLRSVERGQRQLAGLPAVAVARGAILRHQLVLGVDRQHAGGAGRVRDSRPRQRGDSGPGSGRLSGDEHGTAHRDGSTCVHDVSHPRLPARSIGRSYGCPRKYRALPGPERHFVFSGCHEMSYGVDLSGAAASKPGHSMGSDPTVKKARASRTLVGSDPVILFACRCHDFVCRNCHHEFEALVRPQDAAPPTCPACGGAPTSNGCYRRLRWIRRNCVRRRPRIRGAGRLPSARTRYLAEEEYRNKHDKE